MAVVEWPGGRDGEGKVRDSSDISRMYPLSEKCFRVCLSGVDVGTRVVWMGCSVALR